jgi:hypothetical protein
MTDVTIGQLRRLLLIKGVGVDPGWPFCGKIVSTAKKWNLLVKPMIESLPECENPAGLLYSRLLTKVEQAKDVNLFIQRAASRPRGGPRPKVGYSDYND